jgi:PPOX class probable F420-dependent enzyme
MPKPPLPPALDALLARPNPAVVATLARDGGPRTVATWYAWDAGRVLVSMDATRARLEDLRRDPRVAVTVLDGTDWYGHVSLRGRVSELREDVGLADIDRLSRHYRGEAYQARDRPRWSAWIEVDHWHAWNV